MIVSVSRRTDVPAWYSEWFYARLREGFALSRNPRNPKQIKRVSLLPGDVDGFVFWTKNPEPMRPRLSELREYAYYFQFTLTPYGRDIERNLPDKETVLLPAFLRLSDEIGPERVLWRYDPILFTEKYSEAAHIDAFSRMAMRLSGYTRAVTISFIDLYRDTLSRCPCEKPDSGSEMRLAAALSQIAASCGMRILACCEDADLSGLGVGRARCVDAELLSVLSGKTISAASDSGQRPGCGCAKSVDIGAYNTCKNACAYCYANYAPAVIERNAMRNDPASPFLIG